MRPEASSGAEETFKKTLAILGASARPSVGLPPCVHRKPAGDMAASPLEAPAGRDDHSGMQPTVRQLQPLRRRTDRKRVRPDEMPAAGSARQPRYRRLLPAWLRPA